ncbi:hypothetical protein [Rhizobium arsenicireducens]
MTQQQTIAEAIAQAQAAAAAMPAQVTNTPAVQQNTGTAVGAPTAPGAPLGIDDMLSGGVQVDHWLKLSAYGIAIGDKTKPLDDLDVYLNMNEIAYCFQIKYQLNGSAVYHRSYDRTSDAAGGSWMATIQKAQSIDPKAFEYRSAEIPLIAAVDVMGKDGKTVAVKAGETLGLTLSTTGWKPFQTLIRDMTRAGLDVRDGTVKMKLGFEVKQKTGVNDWAIPSFLSFEEIDQVPLFETVH